MKSWFSTILLILVGILLFLGIGGYVLIRSLNYFPGPKDPAEQVCDSKQAQPLSRKKGKIRLLSWNIQYSASRNYHFFYDGGKAVYPSKQDVEATIQAVAGVVKKINPDVMLWQEVDRNSSRTYNIDQLKRYLAATPYPCWAAASYHKSRYVPTPSHQHMKQVDMQLAVFSRFPLQNATRHALPQLNESFLRKAFNLKRAVLEVHIPLAEGGSLVLFDTHFSAFSFNDGTMDKQVQKLHELLQQAEKSGNPWVVVGDMNLLPPGIDPKTLGEEAKYYPTANKNPIDLLFKTWKPGVSLADYQKNPAQYNTYLPFGAKQADRWIDHAFAGSKVKIVKYEVLREYAPISDHLPILIEIELQ